MVSAADVFVVVWDFIKDYFLIIIALLVIGGYQLSKRLKKRKASKKVKKPVVAPVPQEPTVISQPPAPMDDSFESLFNTEQYNDQPAKGDVVDKIRQLSSDIKQEGVTLDDNLRANFENLRKELKETNRKRKEVKAHGVELSKLFEKFRRREVQLTQQLANMESMIEKNKSLK